MKLYFLPLLVIALTACGTSENSETNLSAQENISENATTTTEVQGSEPNSTPIPMSDSNENGRYFLTSQTKEGDVDKIEYIRKGDSATSYAKMEIDCGKNQIRKYSADNEQALQSADMGSWVTPAPDWTDQDIVNFICK